MDILPPDDISRFRELLNNLMSDDNDVRTNAERIYFDIPDEEKILLLFYVLFNSSSSTDEAHMSATLLRRIVAMYKAFANLNSDTQYEIREGLFNILSISTDQSFRRKVCYVAAEIAKNCMDKDGNNDWPAFLRFIFSCASSTDSSVQEMSFLLISLVPEVCGNDINRHGPAIYDLLLEAISRPNPNEVHYVAIKAMCAFLVKNGEYPSIVRHFKNCISISLQLLSEVLDSDNGKPEDIFTNFVDLIESIPLAVQEQTEVLFSLCLKAMLSKKYEESCLNISLELAVMLCEATPAIVRKTNRVVVGKIILEILKRMCSINDEPDWDYSEDYDDEEESNDLATVAESSLDRIACALKGKTVLPMITGPISQMLSSSNWKERYACLMAVGAIGEGCHKEMIHLLPGVIDRILPFLQDSHPRVRYATINCIGQLCTDFSPLFQKKFHMKVIPILLNILIDTTCPRVQAHAGAAFVNFFEDCPKKVVIPYVPAVIKSLESVFAAKLNELMEKGTKFVLEQVVVTISCLADTIAEDFEEYYDRFMPSLKIIVQNAIQPELSLLRGKALECVSLIGLAVGKEKFSSDGRDFMELLMKMQSVDEPLSHDDPQFSYIIASCARICRVLGKEFEPYLPYAIQPILKAANLQLKLSIEKTEDVNKLSSQDNVEIIDLGEQGSFELRAAGLEGKATACEFLVCYASQLKESFAPYVEETAKLMIPLLKCIIHEGLRISAANIMPLLFESGKVCGKEFLEELWKHVFPALVEAIRSEDESDVLYEQLSSLARSIKALNYCCISHEDMLYLLETIKKLMIIYFERSHKRIEARQSLCFDDDMEDSLFDEDKEDSILLGKISFLVTALLSVYKQDFLKYFDLICPCFLSLMEPGRTAIERQWALCAFADVVEHGGPKCVDYSEYFLGPTVAALTDKDPDLRQTASYTIGILSQYGGSLFAKICMESLPILIEMINSPDSRSEKNEKATENAISAVTKVVMHFEINLSDILPMWIKWLPMWEDDEEIECVYGFLCSLLESNNPILLGNNNSNLPCIVRIIAETLKKEAIDPVSDLGKRILTLIRVIQSDKTMFELCISSLDSELKDVLLKSLAST